MTRVTPLVRLLLVVALYGAATGIFRGAAGAEGVTGPVHIKPPDMTVPASAKPGSLRRVIQPFGPWTLICDENLATHKRVCNVSQTLIDATGRTVFSWSLVANESGAPIFIVRLPAALAQDHFAQVVFSGKDPVDAGIILSSCDAATCLGFLDVDPKIQQRIAGHGGVVVRVRIGPSLKSFDASLEGLSQAVASLK